MLPNAKRGGQNQNWLSHLCLSGAQAEVELLRDPCLLGGPQHQVRGKKSELATSPPPSRGPKKGRDCYVTPAFSGVPNAKCMEKIRIAYLTPTFSRAQKREELLRNPCILAGLQHQVRGTKSELVISSMHSQAAQKRAELLCNPCILGGPQRQARGELRNWLPHPHLLGGQNRAQSLRNPCILGGPQRQARGTISELATSQLHSRGAQKRAELLCNTCILGGPQSQVQGENQNWLPRPHLVASPKKGGIAT